MAAQVYAKRLTPEVKARINSAQGLSLDWNRSCSSSLIRTIEGHADAVGAPKEYIFFPLLTVVASFMGVNARMCVNPEWSEPAILWSVVAARKGEKKTAALKRLLNIVEEIEKEEVAEWKAQQVAAEQSHEDNAPGSSKPPQLVVQQFSMEALHNVMLANNHQILGVYDEMSIMYGQLDAYKHSGSRLDRSTLLELYNGGSWCRNFKNRDENTSKMHRTAFNMCGFIQPSFVVAMLNASDPDAFNDRQFFVCPQEVEYKYEELKVPMDPSVPNLKDVFRKIKEVHTKMVQYTFEEDGKQAFIVAHDELCDRKRAIQDDEDRRGVLSKAKGQLARLAMILHVLRMALVDAPEWDPMVTKEDVDCAKVIIDFIIEQKFRLMPPELKVASAATYSCPNVPDNYLAKFLGFRGSQIQASDVSQFRLMPPSPLTPGAKNKYPVEKVREFMGTVANAGFGTIVEGSKNGSKRKSTVFRKHSFDSLGDSQKQTLKKLKLDESYSSSSSLSDASACTPQPLITLNTPSTYDSLSPLDNSGRHDSEYSDLSD